MIEVHFQLGGNGPLFFLGLAGPVFLVEIFPKLSAGVDVHDVGMAFVAWFNRSRFLTLIKLLLWGLFGGTAIRTPGFDPLAWYKSFRDVPDACGG